MSPGLFQNVLNFCYPQKGVGVWLDAIVNVYQAKAFYGNHSVAAHEAFTAAVKCPSVKTE